MLPQAELPNLGFDCCGFLPMKKYRGSAMSEKSQKEAIHTAFLRPVCCDCIMSTVAQREAPMTSMYMNFVMYFSV